MDAAWTPRERLFFWISLAAGLAWCATVMLASPGWSLDDELSHYLRSRSVWENPALIFDAWTRTGRNLFHLLPAHFGLTAARLWTLTFAGVSVVFTAMLATRLGARRAWLAPLLLCFQPWFVELSWGVLTQLPFLLFWVIGIWALASGRLRLSGFCFGFLPLIRHEGIALTAMWATLVAGRAILLRSGWARPVAAFVVASVPLAAYNVAAWICLGELPSSLFFAAKPTEIYGHGTLWHFIPISILPAGIFTLALCAIGLPSVLRAGKTSWPLLFYPAYFALHSVIFWRGLFASGGYYHFLMPMAPGLAVVAIFGADALLASQAPGRRRFATALVVGAVVQGLLLVHLWRDGRPRFTLLRDPIVAALDSALAWQNAHRPNAPAVVCHHIYAAYREDWIETPARRTLDTTPPGNLPSGALVLWDKKYADLTGLPLASLRADPAWTERATFNDAEVRVFEKTR